MSHRRIRTLIVDDSIIYRKVIRDALARFPNVEIIGTASNGRVALERIQQTEIDLLTLDIEMPELDGLGVLRTLQEHNSPVSAIVLSGQTQIGATRTMNALELGAFDFVLKPAGDSLEANAELLVATLQPRIDAFEHSERFRERCQMVAASTPTPSMTFSPPAEPTSIETPAPMPPISQSFPTPEIVVIGVSTGGPATLAQILPKLPANFPVPILIVQHMPPLFTRSLAADLDRQCALDVKEAQHQETIQPGQVRIAPGGRQLTINRQFGRTSLIIRDDPPVKNCRPSVDYLFKDIAHAFGNKALGVILTGMGDDGLDGCRALRHRGAPVIAQDQASCVVYGMPKAVITAGLATQIVGKDDMSIRIMASLNEGARR